MFLRSLITAVLLIVGSESTSAYERGSSDIAVAQAGSENAQGTGLSDISVSVGDTLILDVFIRNPRGERITAYATFLTFNDRFLTLIPQGVDDRGNIIPFEQGSYLRGNVVDRGNSTHGDGMGGDDNGILGFQLDYQELTPPAVGGVRQFASGPAGVVARFRVIAKVPTTSTTITFDNDHTNSRETLYKTLDSISEFTFNAQIAATIHITGPKVEPFPLVQLAPGQEKQIHLDDYVESRLTPDERIVWTIPEVENLTVAFDSTSRQLTIRPDSLISGRWTLRLKATDAEGYSETADLTIIVTSPPHIEGMPDTVSFDEDAAVTFDLDGVVNDADNPDSTLIWIASGGSAVTVAINASRQAIFSARPDWSGEETVMLKVMDPFGVADSALVTVAVRAVNDPPRLRLPATVTMLRGTSNDSLIVGRVVSDVDNRAEDIQLSWSGNQNILVGIASGRIVFNGFGDWFGTEEITFTARDPGGMTDTQRITVTVQRTAPPRVKTKRLKFSLEAGGDTVQVRLDETITDLDTPLDKIAWSLLTRPQQIFVSVDPVTRTVRMASPQGFRGTEEVVLRAQDPEGNSDNLTLVTFSFLGSGDVSPLVSPFPDLFVNPGETKTFNLDDVVSDPDNRDDELSWSVLWPALSQSATGISVEINQDTHIVSVHAAPTAPPGQVTMSFIVTDPQLHTGRGNLRVTVKSPPVITLPDTIAFRADADTLLSLDDYVTDDSPDSVIVWHVIPKTGQIGSVIDPRRRIAAILSAVGGRAAQDTVIFTATDPDSNRTLAAVWIIAVGVPRPISIDFPAKLGIPAGGSITLTLDDFVEDPGIDRSGLLWSVSQTWFLQVSIDNAGRQAMIRSPGDVVGVERVTFTAVDPDGNAGYDSLLVFSAPADGTPVAGGVPDLTITGGDSTTIDLDDFYYDIDNHEASEMRWSVFFPFGEGAAVRVTIDQETHIATIKRRPGGSAKPVMMAQTSSETVFFVVTDPQNRSATFPVAVTVMAQPLVLSGIPDVMLVVGQSDSLQLDTFLTSELPDSVITWRISRTTNVPVFFNEKTRTAVFQSVGEWTGIEAVIVTADDPAGASDSDTLVVTVRKPIGRPPTLAPFPTLTLTPGVPDSIALDSYVNDPDGTDDAMIRWRVTPSDTTVHADLNPLSRQLRLLTSTPFTGERQMLLTATDPDLNSSHGILTVRAALDTTGPGMTVGVLRNPILTSFLAIYIVTDEGLRGMPDVRVGGVRLTVTLVDSSFRRFAADYRLIGDGGSLTVRITGSDSSGNPTEKEKTLTATRVSALTGGTGVSPDKRFKVIVPGSEGGGNFRWKFGGEDDDHLLLITEERDIVTGGDSTTVYTVDVAMEGLTGSLELQAAYGGEEEAAIFRQEQGIWRPVSTTLHRERGLLIAIGEQPGIFSVLKSEGVAATAALPAVYELTQNAPNPFNISTVIAYRLPAGGAVNLTIYNLSGQQVRRLIDGSRQAGEHRVVWDGRDGNGRPVATGIYFYRLIAGEFTATKRMILLK